MNYFEVMILALVEGISEFLPISSTGHLVLTSHFLKIPQTEFVKSFEIIIQLGAILGVVFLYWKRLIIDKNLILKTLTAFVPTAFIGLIFYKLIKDFLIGNVYITLLALFIGGIVLIALEFFYKEKDHHVDSLELLTYKQSFFIGCVQAVSIVPGVSRAAATIIGGLFLGLKRKPATEFSFFLAIPTMASATGLDIVKTGFQFTNSEFMILLTGFITSFHKF